jgi:DNA-binding PucR family transcriptional regulator
VPPLGVGATWAWGGVGGVAGPLPSPSPGVYTALSQGHPGAAGFVRAHHEATAVERLMRLAPSSVRVSGLRHADVELATLLCHDLEDARHFVQRQLGRLAIDDRRTREVRDTLRMYLDHERSIAKVAEQQYISRNTVTYRIKQAEQLSGRRLDRDQLNLHAALLHAALLLGELLGPRVLIAVASGAK